MLSSVGHISRTLLSLRRCSEGAGAGGTESPLPPYAAYDLEILRQFKAINIFFSLKSSRFSCFTFPPVSLGNSQLYHQSVTPPPLFNSPEFRRRKFKKSKVENLQRPKRSISEFLVKTKQLVLSSLSKAKTN